MKIISNHKIMHEARKADFDGHVYEWFEQQ